MDAEAVARTGARVPPLQVRPVTLIPGDGIGPEVVDSARRVLEAAGARISWECHEVGTASAVDPLPPAVLESIRRTGVALKGPVSLPPTGPSVNITLKQQLDLYLQVRPSRSLGCAAAVHQDVDTVVMRETTEDFYAGVEFGAGSPDGDDFLEWLRARGRRLPPKSAVSIRAASEAGSRRMLRASFEYARQAGRQRVTVVHKTAVLRCTDGLFRAVAREVAADYPELQTDELAVDRAAAELAQHPAELDVLVMPGQYGDILSDVAAAVSGGLGSAPGATFGDGVAVFEAVHGTAPKLQGRDQANPLGVIKSGVLMLHHIGQVEPARRVERAVSQLLVEGRALTRDLATRHPGVGTAAATDEIIRLLG